MKSQTSPLLFLVLDSQRFSPEGFSHLLKKLDGAGIDAVILRYKEAPSGKLLNLASQLRAELTPPAKLLLSERCDVAALAGVSGVHLSEEGLSPSQARSLLKVWTRREVLIGRSVHSADSALGEASRGADYLLVGTVFPTDSKPGKDKFEGPELIAEIHSHSPLPLIGIGGIKLDNLEIVIRSGASGIAVSGAIIRASEPFEASQKLREKLNSLESLLSECQKKSIKLLRKKLQSLG